jgi:hypothetical protein
MTVFTNGIPSESKVLSIPLSREISVEQPAGTDIADGGSQSFGSLTSGTSAPLTFTINNTGEGALSLTGVSVTGGNAADFVVNSTGMSSSVDAGGSTTFTVTFTPSTAGSRSTTLQILSDDYDEASFDITLTGTGVNAVPTISDIADQTVNEDGNTGALAFTIGDFETTAASLTVTRSSSNTTLVPTANIVLGGSGASRTVTVTPAANQSGSATITVTVSDGTATVSDTFNLTVNAVNDAPTLNSITNPAAISEDSGQQSVSLSGIAAGGGESQTLTITATSDNTALIPTPSVTYTSPNATGSVLYTPVANLSGTAMITVIVNDGQAANNTFSRTFIVTVNAVNDAPTLDAITNPAAINEDAGRQEGQPIEIPLTEAGDAIRGGGEVDGAISETTVCSKVFRPHRPDGNHIWIHGWVRQAGSAGELVEAVAGRGAGHDPLRGQGGELITQPVVGGKISPIETITEGKIHRGDVVGGCVGIHPL